VTANKSATFDDDAKKLVIATSESCFDTTDNGDGTVTITNYHIETCSYDIVIPEKISGKYVSIIGKDAFAGIKECESEGYCSLPKITSVDLNNLSKLKTIGDGSFHSNDLSELNLNGLSSLETIGTYAFGYNKINKLILSKNLLSLKTINERAFYSNDLSELNLNGLPSLTTISSSAFEGNGINSIVLTNLPSLTTIESYAFSRVIKNYIDENDNMLTISYCSPTYTFGNLPKLKDYDSSNNSGVSKYAFCDLMCSQCGEEKPKIIYENDNVSIFKTQPFGYDNTAQCLDD